METAELKRFSIWANADLMAQVKAKILTVLAPTSDERTENPRAIRALEIDINKNGDNGAAINSVAEKVAYMWFNRIVSLRFLDANGYTASGVVSPSSSFNDGQPEILADAKRGIFDENVVDSKTMHHVTELLNGTRQSPQPQSEAFTLLLAQYCRYWRKAMPFMFARDGDYTELLIPSNLLSDESILSRTNAILTPEVCKDVEVIGWLYQFYISQRKDEVFIGFKKSKKAGAAEIPAATQLFTPHWIVRYLVENSVGRLWMLNNPESSLVEQMKFYIPPVDEDVEFLKISSPEELTVIDPACGSGHMLTYAFDLLYAIYEEEGYSPSEIPTLILTKNLYGTEIDPRAASLAAFALTMKARAKQRSFFKKSVVRPNICVIKPISFNSEELGLFDKDGRISESTKSFWNKFEFADILGALICSDSNQISIQSEKLSLLEQGADLLVDAMLDRAHRVIRQAEYLGRDYAVAIANPPYMGSRQMNAVLSQFMKDEYPNSKSDLFAAFIERCVELTKPTGLTAMITMQSWMFLSSYEKLRISLLSETHITSMAHMGTRAFESIGGEVVSSTAFVLSKLRTVARTALPDAKGAYVRLVSEPSGLEKATVLAAAIKEKTKERDFHLASATDFAAIPGAPIVYWLSEKMREIFSRGSRLDSTAKLAVGLQTGDNDQFLRRWWETSYDRIAFSCTSRNEASESKARWFPYNKGGEFRKWYGNQEFVVNWQNDGAEIRKFGTENGGRPRSRAQNTDKYFSPSVSWSKISSDTPAFRFYPEGFVFDVAGASLFAGSKEESYGIMSFTNSNVAFEQLSAMAPTMNFEIGQVGGLPILQNIQNITYEVASRVGQLVEESRRDWDEFETSWNFARNPLISLIQESQCEQN